MPAVVGQITVNLVANTATFEGNLKGAEGKARESGRNIKEAFDKIELKEGTAGLKLLGEEIGVNLPRHVNSFVATLPGVASAMAAAFPILAVVMLGEKIFEAIEKSEKFEKAIKKAAIEMDAITVSTFKHAESLELDNLKLEDQIAKLSGGFSHNKLAEALIEAKQRSVELSQALEKDIAKADELLGKQSIGAMRSFLTGDEKTSDIEKEVGPKLNDIQRILSAKSLATQQGHSEEVSALNEELKIAVDNAQTVLDKKLDATNKAKLAAAESVGIKSLTKIEVEGPGQAEHNKAIDVINEHYAQRSTILTQISLQLSNINTAEEAAAKNEGLRAKVAGLEGSKDAYAALEKQQKDLLESTLADLRISEAQSVNAFAHKKITAQEWATAEADNIGAVMQAHLDYYSELESATGNAQTRAKLQAEERKFISEEYKKSLDEETAATNKNFQELQKMRDIAFKDYEADEKKQVADAEKTAAAKNKIALAVASEGAQTASMREYMTAVLAGAGALREYNVQLQLQQFIKQHELATPQQKSDVLDQLRQQAAAQDQLAAVESIHGQEHYKDLQRELSKLQEIRTALVTQGQSTLAVDGAMHDVNAAMMKSLDTLLLKQQSVSAGFRAFFNEYALNAKTSAQQVADAMNTATTGMTNSLTNFIVTGQGNWRQLASSMISQIVQMGIQWVLQHTIMAAASHLFHGTEVAAQGAMLAVKSAANVAQATGDAGLAASGAFAFYSAIFPPIAPAMAALQYGIGMGLVPLAGFEKGGVIPNTGIALVHENEGVFSAPVTAAMLGAANAFRQGRSGGGSVRMPNVNYSPSFTLLDKAGVSSALEEHRSVLQQMVREEIMKMA